MLFQRSNSSYSNVNIHIANQEYLCHRNRTIVCYLPAKNKRNSFYFRFPFDSGICSIHPVSKQSHIDFKHRFLSDNTLQYSFFFFFVAIQIRTTVVAVLHCSYREYSWYCSSRHDTQVTCSDVLSQMREQFSSTKVLRQTQPL